MERGPAREEGVVTTAPAFRAHVTSIDCEPGGYMPGMGHRARCACGWFSDCYSQLSDAQRAVEVHLRRAGHLSADFDALLARSTIGAAIADIKTRGIEAHLKDLERRPWRKHGTRGLKRSPAEAAFMRGFGAALASIWRCQHDGQLVQMLIRENNFTLKSFRGVGMLKTDFEAISCALKSRKSRKRVT